MVCILLIPTANFWQQGEHEQTIVVLLLILNVPIVDELFFVILYRNYFVSFRSRGEDSLAIRRLSEQLDNQCKQFVELLNLEKEKLKNVMETTGSFSKSNNN